VIVAHMHYVLFGGSLFGLFAGVYYWWPKATGTMLREGLGRWHFALLALGTNITFFPMFFLGWIGMVRRVPDYEREGLSLWWLNPLETAGAFLIALSTLLFIVNAVLSLRRPVRAEDPWEGHSLEWWTSSPPPRHNFDSLPPITSYAPVFDARHGARARAG
jgi:cytochrome c oxidase subunit 1